MPKLTRYLSQKYLIFTLALLLLILNFSIGCSVRKNASLPPSSQAESPTVSFNPMTNPTDLSLQYGFTSECEEASQWNQFWCTVRWLPQEGQFLINTKNIEATGGQYQMLIDGGKEIQILDTNGNSLYTFNSPIDIEIHQDLRADEFLKLTNSKFSIHELHLQGPITITSEDIDLSLKVAKLTITGEVQIQSFPIAAKAKKNGRNGGQIKIEADVISGHSLSINTNGEAGADGEDGKDLSQTSADDGLNGGFCFFEKPIKLEGRYTPPNIKTCKCTQQVPHNNQATLIIKYTSASLWPTDGKNGRSGGNGSNGFKGGNAGFVTIMTNYSNLDSLQIQSNGGKGGLGGTGGRGERGGKKGQLDSLSECTPENFSWPTNGKDGSRGASGVTGSDGISQSPKVLGIEPKTLKVLTN